MLVPALSISVSSTFDRSCRFSPEVMIEPWLINRGTGANNGGCTTLYAEGGQTGDFPADYYNNLSHLKVTVGTAVFYKTDGSR